jgi:hypothetical protein
MMDPFSRKLFTTRDAREHLRSMGGILSSSPRLAETVAKFNLGGDVIAPVVGASQEPALVVFSGSNFAVFPDGRVVNTDANVEVDDTQDPGGDLRRAVQALVSSEAPRSRSLRQEEAAMGEFGGLPSEMLSQRGTVPESVPGQGIFPSDIAFGVGEVMGLRPALEAAGIERPSEVRAADRAAEAAEAQAPESEPEAEPEAEPEKNPLQDAADRAAADLRSALNLDPPPPPPKDRRERFQQELDLIREVFGDRTKDESRERMANLAMIGLAIAAGQSPDALTNIAQGALAGTQAIQRAQAAERERDDALRMKAFENVLAEEAEERKFTRDLTLAGVRAGAEGSAFTKPTHPVNQWFTTRNQLEQQARDPSSSLWTQTQDMSEEERRQMLDAMALETVLTGVGDTPETQQLIQSVQSGQAGLAFSQGQAPRPDVQARIDQLRAQNRDDAFIRNALREAGFNPAVYGLGQ